MKTKYSIDDENFCYENRSDVIGALDSDGKLDVGDVYYEADFRPIEYQDVLYAESVIDVANAIGYTLIGDRWDDPFSVPLEAKLELQSLLDGWCSKHVELNGYSTIVGESRKVVVR